MKQKSENESEMDKVYLSLGERIKFSAKNIGGASELSRITKIPRGTLQRYIDNETEPKASAVVEICKATKVSVAWLAAGEGLPDGIAEAIKPTDGDNADISYNVVEETSAALYGYLEKKKHVMEPNDFGDAVALLCSMAPEHGTIDIKLIKKLMKFKGNI